MAEKYDYREAVKNDVRDFIHELALTDIKFADMDELNGFLCDCLYASDDIFFHSLTNAKYPLSRKEAEANLSGNQDLLRLAKSNPLLAYFDYYDYRGLPLADLRIRCYLLPKAVSAVLTEIEDEFHATYGADREMIKDSTARVINEMYEGTYTPAGTETEDDDEAEM